MKYRTDFVTNSSSASSILVTIWTDQSISSYNSINDTEYVSSSFIEDTPRNSFGKAIYALLSIRMFRGEIELVNSIMNSEFDRNLEDYEFTSALRSYIEKLKIDTTVKFEEFVRSNNLFNNQERIIGTFFEYTWQGWQGEYAEPVYQGDFSVVNLTGYKITTVGVMDKSKVIDVIQNANGQYVENVDETVDFIITGRKPGKKLDEAIKLGVKQIPSWYFENQCEGVEGDYEMDDDRELLLYYEKNGFRIDSYPHTSK